jgi:hypothetical protein
MHARTTYVAFNDSQRVIHRIVPHLLGLMHAMGAYREQTYPA